MTKPRRLVTLAGMIALATTAALSPAYAWEQLQIGQVYIVRTPSAGLCPRLEWHFVVDAHRSMIGSLECDWLTRVATLAGRLNPDDSFQLSAAEAGGGRSANISGKFTSRYMVVSVDGTGSACNQQTFQVLFARNPGLAGGGG